MGRTQQPLISDHSIPHKCPDIRISLDSQQHNPQLRTALGPTFESNRRQHPLIQRPNRLTFKPLLWHGRFQWLECDREYGLNFHLHLSQSGTSGTDWDLQTFQFYKDLRFPIEEATLELFLEILDPAVCDYLHIKHHKLLQARLLNRWWDNVQYSINHTHANLPIGPCFHGLSYYQETRISRFHKFDSRSQTKHKAKQSMECNCTLQMAHYNHYPCGSKRLSLHPNTHPHEHLCPLPRLPNTVLTLLV